MSGPSTETSRTWSGNWANLPTAEGAQARAILVADIVGYTNMPARKDKSRRARLAGADEERTLARVRGLRNASSTLRNSMIAPSPVRLTMRPAR